jgi:hypothetical protein
VLESHTEAVSTVQPPFPAIIPLEASTEPARRVRFYNRVRITSGVGHTGRPKSDSPKQEGSQTSLQDGYVGNNGNTIDIPPRRDALHHSADSSTSASYSSSISAPLRSSTEFPPKPASARFAGRRGKPLSNVLGSQDANSWLHALAVERRERKNKRMSRAHDETSPLLEANGTAAARIASPDVPQSMQENGHKPDDDDSIDDDWPWKLFTLYVKYPCYRAWTCPDSPTVLGVSAFCTLLL